LSASTSRCCAATLAFCFCSPLSSRGGELQVAHALDLAVGIVNHQLRVHSRHLLRHQAILQGPHGITLVAKGHHFDPYLNPIAWALRIIRMCLGWLFFVPPVRDWPFDSEILKRDRAASASGTNSRRTELTLR
jgi:hypothetical protein